MPSQAIHDILIGLKLELGFAELPEYRQLLGDDVVGALGPAGVEAVELPVGPETEGEVLAGAVSALVLAGLRVSLHPYTEGTAQNPASFASEGNDPCRRFHERILATAGETARLQQSVVVVNIHPAAGPLARKRAELLERSIRFFAWAHRYCRKKGLAVRPVAELQAPPLPGEDVQRVGDSYDELLRVVTRAEVGACWDFGHAGLSHRARGTPLDPPERFVQRVAHVHCHDLHRADHQPLIHDGVPWRNFLGLLRRRGFRGTVILEVPAQAFLTAGGRSALDHSLSALAAVLGRPASATPGRG